MEEPALVKSAAILPFNPNHEDLVHDIKYDFYGRRLATCSTDHRVKVFDLVNQQWQLNDSWKAHDSAVLKLSWAHPEYGQIIASCSFDRYVRVWEEQEEEDRCSEKRWSEKARLVDSRGTVQSVEFAPNHLGLKLACASVDGIIRVYEAIDIVNLGHWTLMEEFETGSGSVNPNGGEQGVEICLSWCKSRVLPPQIVVGCGRRNVAQIFRYDDSQRKWIPSELLEGHKDVIHDICWAPSIGRSYQLIATACRDKMVRIYKIYPDEKVVLDVELDAHGREVWRVEWNVTGTILSSSGDDGQLILWKRNFLGEWQQINA